MNRPNKSARNSVTYLVLLTLVVFCCAHAQSDEMHNFFNPAYQQRAFVKASNTDFGDTFGWAVSVSGDTMVVGARSERSDAPGIGGDENNNNLTNSGAVYVFINVQGVWQQQAYIKASNPDEYDHFGESVSISGDTLVVGAANESSNATTINGNQLDNSAQSSGAAYVFIRTNGVWSQQAYLKADNAEANDYFGTSVAIDGETIVIGANGEDSDATGVNGDDNNLAGGSGAAYVFVRSNGTWSQHSILKASNTDVGDAFAYAIAISADTIVVGAHNEDGGAMGVNGEQDNNSATTAGAAYVFHRNNNLWSQQSYLKASNTNIEDWFGLSVAVSGNTIVVGAINEASSATGVNGQQVNNAAILSGAAYVFVRNEKDWSQQAYLKASNTGAGDQFGFSVAVNGENILVGAWRESSNATGIDGDQTNNSSSTAGSAYLFTRTNTQWQQKAYIKASNTGNSDAFGNSVAISNNLYAVGARFEGSNAVGVNGDGDNDLIIQSGAVYLYNFNPLIFLNGFESIEN